ncbi:MAG: hypothetical protein WBD13_02055 [Burkholderiaceae bacterium]
MGKDPIPNWIIWYGVIVMVGAPLANAVMTFAGTNLGMVTLADGSEIDTALFEYAVRNIAAAVITGYALYKRSAAMLLIIFFMQFMTEAGDFLDSLLLGETDVVGIASFVAMMIFLAFIPYTIAIRKLWPMVR